MKQSLLPAVDSSILYKGRVEALYFMSFIIHLLEVKNV